jgi:hypothetical protein
MAAGRSISRKTDYGLIKGLQLKPRTVLYASIIMNQRWHAGDDRHHGEDAMKLSIHSFRGRMTKFQGPGLIIGILVFGAILALTTTARSESWKSKDWTRWTLQDCMQITTDSPWADTYREHQAYLGNDTIMPSPVTAVVSSSLMIRQAYVRQQQLRIGQSDLISPEMRNQGEAMLQDRSDACLNESFSDRIVVTITGVFPGEFKTPPELEVSGRKYPPMEISQENPVGKACTSHMLIAGLPASEYVYPRVVNGNPVIGPKDKRIVITTATTWAHNFVFNLQRMVYKGKPDF